LNRSLLYLPFALIPKTVFGVEEGASWHPSVYYIEEEKNKAAQIVSSRPKAYNIMLETSCRSGQSAWDNNTTNMVINECKRTFGSCNFYYVSRNSNPKDGIDCSYLSARECLPLYNFMDLFIGCCSGISCLTCSWNANEKVNRIQFCYGNIGTTNISFGKEKVASDVGSLEQAIRRSGT
jgi:hypothetical protein